MTDTPAADVEPEPTAPRGPARWFAGWSETRRRNVFLIAFALALITNIGAIWLVAVAPDVGGEGARASVSQLMLLILIANLVLIGGLAAVVGRRAFSLVRRRRGDAGARLHLRFVVLFSSVALVPAILIALVFGVLVNRGVDQWFSDNVQAAVDNGAAIGLAYTSDVSQEIDADISVISEQLEGIRPLFGNRIQFSDALSQVGQLFGYPAVYILDENGEVLASGEGPNAPPYVAPSRDALEEAQGQEAPSVQQLTEGPDAIRGLRAFPAYGDAYLYLVRPLQPGLIGQVASARESIVAYKEAQDSRARIQAVFTLSYLETALLVLVGAVWLGMSAANSISAPIGRLVVAADRVAGGDLAARVDAGDGPGEIRTLSDAFNRMTGDLEAQQAALRAASEEATGRSRFIETVLSGVSAGVIGVDRQRRVSAINDSAVDLLGIFGEGVIGRLLGEVSPELSELARRAEAHIEEEIDVSTDGETRRLRVRIEGGVGGEMVLTFDDITRLVTAQRNAAWRDVARRIAHEIKNPLTPIQLSAERLRRRYRKMVEEDVEVFDRCTETIIRQVGDIGRMVDEFSSFARMPAPRFTAANPAELLREAVFAQRVAAPDIDIDLVEPLPRVTIHADRQMVGQALTNILKNAGEAVAARREANPKSDEGVGISARLSVEDAIVTFVIEDDGPGLPARDRDRLTEPYVTTREKGTGLGLAIVKRICEEHGGELKLADAETLSGARVCLIFPLKSPVKAPGPKDAKASGGVIPAAE
ncbi:PAS domain-containing sensor histidine kinase [Brevundimonas sp. M20]|uniref:sensor histidine kinase NtrY-like n=1 Tax=Brevundimonas sp. M20 TaxID=2591463 RepID=UPI001146A091|nr:PAS domain-containing sensor histidine kinase [Brevundimonas sp. M20]QDH73260.1 PAS domain-containing sensor histidine kinase [Brevundimonas sp. M20]